MDRRGGKGIGDGDDREAKMRRTGAEKPGDLISCLPIDLSRAIFFRLHTIYGVRTTAVSRRWLWIWQTTPLNLNDNQIGGGDIARRIGIINRILDTHPGPVGRFCLSSLRISPYISLFERWFARPIFDNLDELLLVFPVSERHGRQALPSCVLWFNNVRVLSITNCLIRDNSDFRSRRLVVVELCRVNISTQTLQHLFSTCPDISAIRLDRNTGYGTLSLQLRKLRRLFVFLDPNVRRNDRELNQLTIADSENLELVYVNQYAYGPSVTISGASRLRTLGYFGFDTPRLQIDDSIFQQSALDSASYYTSVSTLAIKVFEVDISYVTDFLHFFPYLETLHILFVDRSFDHFPIGRTAGRRGFSDPFAPINCLQHTLRNVMMWCFSEVYPPVELANYFINKACILECMTLASQEWHRPADTLSMVREMNISNRASARAKFHFALVYDRAHQVMPQINQADPFSLLCRVYYIIEPQSCDARQDDSDNDTEDDGEIGDISEEKRYSQGGLSARITDSGKEKGSKDTSSSGQKPDGKKTGGSTCSTHASWPCLQAGSDSRPLYLPMEMVASMDCPEITKYRGLVSAQPHRQEIIEDLFTVSKDPQKGHNVNGGMIRELLIAFCRKTIRRPERIIFYRDGASEGQFSHVLLHEMDAIRKACAEEGYLPPVTFVVVQKRHLTRLFPEVHGRCDMTDKSGNVLPGTVVDQKICHPTEFDFYLCSHAGIQGTSRPTHYHVLYDENHFTADALQSLTNNLCYTYARCTRAMSVVPPAYYAHLVAFRARYYVEGESSDGGSTPGSSGQAVAQEGPVEVCVLPKIKDNVKDVMFYC